MLVFKDKNGSLTRNPGNGPVEELVRYQIADDDDPPARKPVYDVLDGCHPLENYYKCSAETKMAEDRDPQPFVSSMISN
jgi:hypothetical protein